MHCEDVSGRHTVYRDGHPLLRTTIDPYTALPPLKKISNGLPSVHANNPASVTRKAGSVRVVCDTIMSR